MFDLWATVERVLYLLRHGETEWSRERRKKGRGDSPLTVQRSFEYFCQVTIGKLIPKQPPRLLDLVMQLD
jgi:bisphosphoglycerate-dependent phosphoglycerate mutase